MGNSQPDRPAPKSVNRAALPKSFPDAASAVIEATLREILSSKHLYQNVDVPSDWIKPLAAAIFVDVGLTFSGGSGRLSSREALEAEGSGLLRAQWVPSG